MIEETRKIYRCEHCGKIYLRKDFALKHELFCSKNPENPNDKCECFHFCENLVKKDTTAYEGDLSVGDGEREISVFYCTKRKVFLYPPKVAMKGNQFELDEPNEQMPTNCPYYKFDPSHVVDKKDEINFP